MAKSLKLTCPSCDRVTPHWVEQTDGEQVSLRDRDDLFNRLIGKDLTFRRRQRRCERCFHQYSTVEFRADALDKLLSEIDRLNEIISLDRQLSAQVGQRVSSLLESAAGLSRLSPYLTIYEAVFGVGDDKREKLSAASTHDILGFIEAGDRALSLLPVEDVLVLDQCHSFLDTERRRKMEAEANTVIDLSSENLSGILRKLRHPTCARAFRSQPDSEQDQPVA